MRIRRRSVGFRMRKALSVSPFRYQVQGVRFLVKHDGRALLGDDMGLGKTLQAIAWMALHPSNRPVVVVCPASFKYGWQREILKMSGLRSTVCVGGMPTKASLAAAKLAKRKRLLKLPQRKRRKAFKALRREFERKHAAMFRKRRETRASDILIINYDIIDSWAEFLIEIGVSAVVMDECQNVMNPKAKRTKACRKLSRTASHVIGLSGTPIHAGPIQFFPILNMIRPHEFSSRWKFAMDYCAPKQNKWGWDFSGATNLDELHERLQSVMIRRMKVDVLKNLPRKLRQVMPVDIDNRREYEKAKNDFLEWVRKNKGKKALAKAKRAEAIVRMGALLQIAAEGKLKFGIQWIKDWLTSTDEKLIVFGRHKKILQALHDAFPGAARIDGSVPINQRQGVVDRFQTDPKCRLFLGHLKAAGTAITLTAASNVAFFEIGWTPAAHDQAEDRALRIGQEAATVNVIYLVGVDTLEERLLEVLDLKSSTIARVLDGKQSGGMKLLNSLMKGM